MNTPINSHRSDSHWTSEDVADYLGMSRSWVYAEANAGRLPHRRFGTRIRFDPAEIRAWAEKQDQSRPAAKVLDFKSKGRK